MISERMKSLREEHKMPKTEIAAALSMKYSTYNNYETGTREPGSDTLIALAEYYDVTIDYLLGRTNDKKATVKTDDGLREDNVKFRDYSMVFDDLRAKLIQEGVLGPDEDFTPDLLRLFLLLGEDTAVKVLKSKGIDPSVLLK